MVNYNQIIKKQKLKLDEDSKRMREFFEREIERHNKKKANLKKKQRTLQAITKQLQEVQQALSKKEKELSDYQKQKFGPDGALFKKRQELVRPIQDKVYAAIEDYSESKGYDLELGVTGGLLFFISWLMNRFLRENLYVFGSAALGAVIAIYGYSIVSGQTPSQVDLSNLTLQFGGLVLFVNSIIFQRHHQKFRFQLNY
mgnify:CR=1 FL=1